MGTDKITAEMIQNLNEENNEELLHTINQIKKEKKTPKRWRT